MSSYECFGEGAEGGGRASSRDILVTNPNMPARRIAGGVARRCSGEGRDKQGGLVPGYASVRA
eukprot:4389696-Pyramimonas_sp.AAC.1